jgi:hypothetical protein
LTDPELDPDILLAAVIEAVAENLSGDDADVIPFPKRDDVNEGLSAAHEVDD